jgi:hypothetical protein
VCEAARDRETQSGTGSSPGLSATLEGLEDALAIFLREARA